MASVTLQVKGAEEVAQKLRDMADPSKLRKIVALNGSELQQKAQQKAPVDTGQLRRSIRLEIEADGMTAVVSANTDYAAYQEYGTRFMPAHPYLRPSLNEQGVQFIEDIKRLVKG